MGKWGRKKYSLYRGGKSISERGNVLVALAFLGPIPKGMVVAHYPDRDAGNNKPSNLMITTHKVNAAHKREQGTAQIGCENPNARVNEEIVRGLRTLYASGMKIRAIARETGLDRSMVKQIVKYETWKHVVCQYRSSYLDRTVTARTWHKQFGFTISIRESLKKQSANLT